MVRPESGFGYDAERCFALLDVGVLTWMRDDLIFADQRDAEVGFDAEHVILVADNRPDNFLFRL